MRRLLTWCRENPAWVQMALGLFALLIGTLIYVFGRDAAQVYFLPDQLSRAGDSSAASGGLGGSLPDFLHSYAFILLSCAVLQPGRQGAIWIAVFWLFVEFTFELGQHPAVSPVLIEYVPGWFTHVPVLENTRAYFDAGHFDPFDLFAFALGAICAWLTVAWMPAYDVATGARR